MGRWLHPLSGARFGQALQAENPGLRIPECSIRRRNHMDGPTPNHFGRTKPGGAFTRQQRTQYLWLCRIASLDSEVFL
jgi:hypothetical protein